MGFRRGKERWVDPPEAHAPVVLAYAPQARVFVGLPPAAFARGLEDDFPPVPIAALRRARAGGIHDFVSMGQWIVAFRPERIRSALVALTEQPRPVASRRMEMAEGIDHAFGIRTSRFGYVGTGARKLEVRPRRRARRRRPKVETGFSPVERPAAALRPDTPLVPGGVYAFWFGVGVGSGASIEEVPAPLPEQLRDGTRLTVRLVSLDGELDVHGADQGEIEVTAKGAIVRTPALEIEAEPALRRERLFFRVVVPEREGTFRLRCSVYHGSTLVQSRLIKARVGESEGRALSSRLDYRISSRLSLAELSRLPEHELSLVVNGDEDSHQLHFFHGGDESFANSASLAAEQLAETIELGRRALREAAWGTPDEWDGKVGSYRYRSAGAARKNFSADLVALARAGAGLYTEIATELAGGVKGRRRLEEISAVPGRVQVAAVSSSLYVPAGLFYDHPIDDVPAAGARTDICADFLAAMSSSRPLEECTCMTAGCANRRRKDVVCPSGFWGFRHELGWPPSMAEPVAELPRDGDPRVLIGVSTDGGLRHRRRHVRDVAKLVAGEGVEVADSLDRFAEAMRKRTQHLVYMYCHGGMRGQVPYVELGPRGSTGLTRNFLRTEGPWSPPPPRSVVFINGCHTTQVGPRQILTLVNGFVREAGVAGVIGTELTVFEPLACAFAEAMLPGFLSGKRSAGAAVRHARLELLRMHNPLGLVYVPFIAADTKLVPRA
jgi:hypothetical protein